MNKATRFVTREWTFKSQTDMHVSSLSVVVNLDVLTDKVVASAIGPEKAAALAGSLRRESYTNANRGISTRYSVVFTNGTATEWERSRQNALDAAGNAAIKAALGR